MKKNKGSEQKLRKDEKKAKSKEGLESLLEDEEWLENILSKQKKKRKNIQYSYTS